MFKLWKHRRPIEPGRVLKTRPDGERKLPKTSAERRRLADTDGTLRRMRQQVEDNRLL